MSKRNRQRPAAEPADPTGPYVIRVMGVAGYSDGQAGEIPAGQFVRSYDAKYGGGRGFMTATPNPRQAFAFPSMAAAHAAWTEVPANNPVRPDGKPNRPMTAYTVEIVRLEDALAEESV